jgi:hypothetical protein
MGLVISKVIFIPDPFLTILTSDQEELCFCPLVVCQQVHGEGYTVVISIGSVTSAAAATRTASARTVIAEGGIAAALITSHALDPVICATDTSVDAGIAFLGASVSPRNHADLDVLVSVSDNNGATRAALARVLAVTLGICTEHVVIKHFAIVGGASVAVSHIDGLVIHIPEFVGIGITMFLLGETNA